MPSALSSPGRINPAFLTPVSGCWPCRYGCPSTLGNVWTERHRQCTSAVVTDPLEISFASKRKHIASSLLMLSFAPFKHTVACWHFCPAKQVTVFQLLTPVTVEVGVSKQETRTQAGLSTETRSVRTYCYLSNSTSARSPTDDSSSYKQ